MAGQELWNPEMLETEENLVISTLANSFGRGNSEAVRNGLTLLERAETRI